MLHNNWENNIFIFSPEGRSTLRTSNCIFHVLAQTNLSLLFNDVGKKKSPANIDRSGNAFEDAGVQLEALVRYFIFC